MFDLTSSKLLILGIVALIVVGPKDLPVLLRTIGKYLGMIRRQANEFKAQFDEAMRESELDSLKREIEGVGRDVETTMRKAEQDVEREMREAEADIERSLETSPGAAASASDTTLASDPVLDGAAFGNTDSKTVGNTPGDTTPEQNAPAKEIEAAGASHSVRTGT